MSNPYVSFTWVDRDSEFPTRRILSYIDPSTQQSTTLQVTVSRDEGTVTTVGTPFAATYMNDLERRVNDAFAKMNVEYTGTLTAGQTTLVLSDQTITTNTRVEGILLDVDPFSTGIAPLSCTVATGSITLTFEAQSFDLGVIVEVRNDVV